jgi:hypothetical protein
MFRTVRHWWGSGRGKDTARLFLFEFLVVVAGVLTAQALANWVSDRADARAVSEEDQRVRYEIGRARQNARVWLVAAPCLEQRVNQIIRAASTERQLESDDLQVPQFIGYTVEPLSPDMRREFQSRYGVDAVDDYAAISSASSHITQNYDAVRQDWDRFALLDPDLGHSSAADHATVRDVAVEARSQLRRLRNQAEIVEQTAARIGIPPRTSDAEDGSAAPVTSCAEIWRTGRVWRSSPTTQ